MALFEIQVQGQGGAYTIKRAKNGADWYCSCPAWKFQRVTPGQRTCKHIDALAASLMAYVTATPAHQSTQTLVSQR